MNTRYGRGDRTWTCGILVPNAARYQLRYTPIVIKLWSCKWSNLWSNTFLTAIFCFPNRPKSARLKGFRRFSLSCGENTVYAPKRIYDGTFRRKWLFPPLSARKTALFGTPQSTVSECSETVGGLLCGQQGFLQNNTHYTPLVITREGIAFYMVIITLNSTWFKSKFAPQ